MYRDTIFDLIRACIDIVRTLLSQKSMLGILFLA